MFCFYLLVLVFLQFCGTAIATLPPLPGVQQAASPTSPREYKQKKIASLLKQCQNSREYVEGLNGLKELARKAVSEPLSEVHVDRDDVEKIDAKESTGYVKCAVQFYNAFTDWFAWQNFSLRNLFPWSKGTKSIVKILVALARKGNKGEEVGILPKFVYRIGPVLGCLLVIFAETVEQRQIGNIWMEQHGLLTQVIMEKRGLGFRLPTANMDMFNTHLGMKGIRQPLDISFDFESPTTFFSLHRKPHSGENTDAYNAYKLDKDDYFVYSVIHSGMSINDLIPLIASLPKLFPQGLDTRDWFEKHSVLYCAAGNGDLNLVRALLNEGVEVNSYQSIEGFTPLFASVLSNNLPMVQLLLDSGARPEMKTRAFIYRSGSSPTRTEDEIDGTSPIYQSIVEDNFRIFLLLVEYLLQNKQDVNDNLLLIDSPIELIIRQQKYDFAKVILCHVDVMTRQQALNMAVFLRDTKMVEVILLSGDCDVNYVFSNYDGLPEHLTLLEHACEDLNYGVIELLVDRGARLSMYCLQILVEENEAELLSILFGSVQLDDGLSEKELQIVELLKAVLSGNENTVQSLLTQKRKVVTSGTFLSIGKNEKKSYIEKNNIGLVDLPLELAIKQGKRNITYQLLAAASEESRRKAYARAVYNEDYDLASVFLIDRPELLVHHVSRRMVEYQLANGAMITLNIVANAVDSNSISLLRMLHEYREVDFITWACEGELSNILQSCAYEEESVKFLNDIGVPVTGQMVEDTVRCCNPKREEARTRELRRANVFINTFEPADQKKLFLHFQGLELLDHCPQPWVNKMKMNL